MTDETELMQELRNACENFFDSWFGPPIGQPEHLERIEERRKKTKKEFADKLFKFVMLWMADTRHADLAPTVTDDTLSEEDLQAIVSIPMDRKYDHLNDELKHTVTDEASASENYCVSDTEKRKALDDLDRCIARIKPTESIGDVGARLLDVYNGHEKTIRAALQTPSDESLRKELEQAKAKQKELMSSHAELLEAADFLLFSLHDLEKYQEVALPNNAIWLLKQAITNAEALINALGTNVTEKLLEGK